MNSNPDNLPTSDDQTEATENSSPGSLPGVSGKGHPPVTVPTINKPGSEGGTAG